MLIRNLAKLLIPDGPLFGCHLRCYRKDFNEGFSDKVLHTGFFSKVGVSQFIEILPKVALGQICVLEEFQRVS